MSLFKRNSYWHYDFTRNGTRFQGTTGVKNINLARQVEAKIKSDVALAKVGIAPPKLSPLFREFAARFLSHVRQHSRKSRTVEFYETRTARLLDYFADFRLSDIDENLISRYKADRAVMRRRPRGKFRAITPGKAAVASVPPVHAELMAANAKRIGVSTINRELATLRKALGLAYEWRLIARLPKMRLLPGEKGREYVLTGEMETAYLSAIHYPLKQAAILMLDCGLRPEECVQLCKRHIDRDAMSIHVDAGKTHNARRTLPITERVRETLDLLFALFPDSEWLFPGKGKALRSGKGQGGTRQGEGATADDTCKMPRSANSKHMTRAHLDHLHQAARREHGWPKEFVIYSMRHTYGTRLAESGASPFEICRLMGHSSIKVSERYIHLSADSLTLAAKRKEAYDRILRGETVHDETPTRSKS